MHGLDTSNVSSRVESSQVEFELISIGNAYLTPRRISVKIYGIVHRQPAINNKLAPKPTPKPNPNPSPNLNP